MRVFMRKDGSTLRVQPLISVRVVEMPVGVDQVFDRLTAKAANRFQNLRASRSDTRVDE